MGRILLFFVVLGLLGCAENTVSVSDLHYLNGYWEIEEVSFPGGEKKNYGFNPSVDFIQVEDQKGYRKKMQPRFDGSYLTSNKAESFEVTQVGQSLILRYQTHLGEWEETLIQLDSLSFTVVSQDGLHYAYKRFQPIQIPE